MASTFCNVNPDEIAYVDIFPPVGIARVGDSSEHFLAPEVPGVEAIPDGGFKDKDFKIKKQVARFRVYAFGKDGKVLGEITNAHYDLKWTVHVASKKAAWVIFRGKYRTETWQLRNKTVQGWPNGTPPEGTPQSRYDYTNTRTQLIIDSGERVIEGANTKDVFLDGVFGKDSDKIPHTQVRLGELRTDDQGHLLVLASDGDSFSVFGSPHQDLHSKFDNDGWVDKMADGTVRVTVKSKSKPDLDIPVKNRATVITAPPRFASGTHCPTSLYELIEEVYERRLRREPNYNVGDVVYYRDIYPLFKRIYLLSWTNQSAADGHGSTQMDYFDNPELADPQADNSARVALFKRIRDPVIDGDQQNEQTRNRQAFSRFMPQLSGDGGDAQPRVRDSWASLTQRQWALLKKWSEGQFTTGKPEVPYGSFNEIPLEEQPSALTRSALEWSIGAPLYPGIECFWHAQQDEMYKPGDRFRFADTVTPGDLGKGLSLPWQSDFNMCNTNWWPSVRPDDVVTEAYFQQVQQASPPEQLASNLTDRSEWARGVNTNSDMVRGWNKLGFVAKQPYGDSPNLPEILVEKQRSTSIAPL